MNDNEQTSTDNDTGEAVTSDNDTERQSDEAGEHDGTGTERHSDEAGDEGGDDDADERVAALRREAAGYRTRLRDTESERDTLAAQLRTALISLDGRLAPGAALPGEVDLTAEAVGAAIDTLLEEQPHLRRRRPAGGIGQGEGTGGAGDVSLLGLLRG